MSKLAHIRSTFGAGHQPAREYADLPSLAARAAELVHEAQSVTGTGAAKRRQVVAQLAADVDETLTYGSSPLAGILEMLDGPAIQLLLNGLVEAALAGLRRTAIAPLVTAVAG